MATRKRDSPRNLENEPQNQPGSKKLKLTDAPDPPINPRVVLNPADCNLDFNVEGDGLRGSALHERGFAYCWSGARANVGITGGKYCFGCKIISVQPVQMEDTATEMQHVCRVGVSLGSELVGNLGETESSFGYGGTGKFSVGNNFLTYGERYGVGDTIVCAIDLENKPMASIGFSKNGKWLGTAKQFDAGKIGLRAIASPAGRLKWESALFPHVLLKNVVVEVQFSVEDGLVPEGAYKPWASAMEDGNAFMGPAFADARDCEVMMMVGLPASGKTTWAEKWVKDYPEKRYVLLGTNLILDQMKVPGLTRKHNYGERFDRLMDRATEIFNALLSRAAMTPRNYILDQTNVYKSARKRKLKPFAHFLKIAVVVFPRPEELRRRSQNRFREMGKEVPPDAVNQMIANFALPKSKDMPNSDEFFDQVIFTELDRAESQRCLDKMKQSLPSAVMDQKDNFYPQNSSIKSFASVEVGRASSADENWRSSFPPPPSVSPTYQVHSQRQPPVYESAIPYESYRGNYGTVDAYSHSRPLSDIPNPRYGSESYPRYGAEDSYSRQARSSFPSYGAPADPYMHSTLQAGNARNPVAFNTSGGHYGGRWNPTANTNNPMPADPYMHSVEPFQAGNARNPVAFNTSGGHYGGRWNPTANTNNPMPPTYMHGPPPDYGSPSGPANPRHSYELPPAHLPPPRGYMRPHSSYY